MSKGYDTVLRMLVCMMPSYYHTACTVVNFYEILLCIIRIIPYIISVLLTELPNKRKITRRQHDDESSLLYKF